MTENSTLSVITKVQRLDGARMGIRIWYAVVFGEPRVVAYSTPQGSLQYSVDELREKLGSEGLQQLEHHVQEAFWRPSHGGTEKPEDQGASGAIATVTDVKGDIRMAPHSGHYKSRSEHTQSEGIAPADVEPIHLTEALNLGFHLGNAVKYIARAEHKGTPKEDLDKAVWYIQRWLRTHGLTS